MRRVFAIVAALLSMGIVEAKCLPKACFVLAVETTACETPMPPPPPPIDSQGEADPRDQHVTLTVSVVGAAPAPCYAGESAAPVHVEEMERIRAMKKFYYANSPGEVCDWFQRNRAALYLPATCCDSVSASGVCRLDAPVLKDPPPWVSRPDIAQR